MKEMQKFIVTRWGSLPKTVDRTGNRVRIKRQTGWVIRLFCKYKFRDNLFRFSYVVKESLL